MGEGSEVDQAAMVRAVVATLAIAGLGFAIGRMTAPGSDLDYVVSADRIRAGQVKACVDDFKGALELFRNSSASAIAEERATHEKALSAIQAGHQEDLKVMKLAIAGCDAEKGIAH